MRRGRTDSRGDKSEVELLVEDGKLRCIKSSWNMKLYCVLGLSLVMGFRIFVRSVLNPTKSLFQSVLKN